MPARVYKSNPKELLAEGQPLIKNIQDPCFRHRLEMVNLVLQDVPATSLSQGYKEDASTISRWVRTVDESGFSALRPKKRAGRQPRLDDKKRGEVCFIHAHDGIKNGHQMSLSTIGNFIFFTVLLTGSGHRCEELFNI